MNFQKIRRKIISDWNSRKRKWRVRHEQSWWRRLKIASLKYNKCHCYLICILDRCLARPCPALSMTYVMLPWLEPMAFCRQHINHDILGDTRDGTTQLHHIFPLRHSLTPRGSSVTCTTVVTLQMSITIFCWIFRNVKHWEYMVGHTSFPLARIRSLLYWSPGSLMTTLFVTCQYNGANTVTYTLQPRRWKQYVLPKCWYPPTRLRGATSWKTTTWTITERTHI
jgi:hypothetical protein